MTFIKNKEHKPTEEFIISTKSIPQKLLIKEGEQILLINPPENYKILLVGKIPKDVTFHTESEENLDMIQIFIRNRKELEDLLPKMKPKLKSNGKLWVSYLKGTSKSKTDINRDSLREYAKSIGLKTIGLVSIDKDWSSMRLKIND